MTSMEGSPNRKARSLTVNIAGSEFIMLFAFARWSSNSASFES
ncbi:hypothetical protein EG68_02653 [Paragonimus skrjabini miyazakii]|uniref:Uncharacterized protein n=1 Tax=Paragonimus skrjabini miyazakii TaxID=59628 RepID=A0A8S9YBR9_9TREM|nr:hypothetical protein EG68_02653 [Paragonimus skrjabini miyazakii]